MTTCARCSAALGVGRFCTNCGHRVGAELPPDPTTPRPVHEAPPPARFPLWADATGEGPTVPPADVPAEDPPTATIPVVADTPVVASTPAPRPGGSQTALVLAVVGVVVVLALVAGALLLLRGGDGDDTAATDPSPSATAPTPSPSASATSDSPSPSPSSSQEPMPLADVAGISAPPAGPTSADVATGQPITYVAQNMLDGDPTTCWRTPGDAGGQEIVLRLPSPTTLVEVGLINGYAKTSKADGRTYDWYHGNRRVLSVEWIFDDGTRLTQDLRDTRSLQRLDVQGVKTTTVRMRLLSVSQPGTGPAGKDNTAISEISLIGAAPQG